MVSIIVLCFQRAMLRLIQGDHRFPCNHTLHSYKYQGKEASMAHRAVGVQYYCCVMSCLLDGFMFCFQNQTVGHRKRWRHIIRHS